ncbi:DNA cytosine methyltransferase [Clostridium sp.]|uniref:DNA cytosine methyltransferase n=1 Tax=Clostridium sp. TaxID=1506 RepID=UPI0032166DB9
METYNFIDLFAGCGGLSEGFYKEGYSALLHLEMNKAACETLKTRMKYYGYSDFEINNAVMCDDITRKGLIEDIEKRVNSNVDLIIGGPPCQAFSTVGRAQDPNSMKNDPRNYLFENYLEILNHFKPKVFIFENVKGLLSAKPMGVDIFKLIISKMRETYNVIDDPKIIILNSVNYGVPQLRERVILIGVRKDIELDPKIIYDKIKKTHYSPDANEIKGLKKYVTVRDAIADLPKLFPGEGKEVVEDYKTDNNEYLNILKGTSFDKVYNHVARKHNEKDRERYRILSENKNWQLKDLQKIRPDLVHHDPKHFGNRYTVQEYDKPGKTIVAHLYKDGNLFIHPDSKQGRTFTVREAARIQSFPDDFLFEGSRTEQYKQVGNAVPPLLAQACAKAIKKVLKDMKKE